MSEIPIINGALILERRRALGLSRNAFAQLVDMRPGALWRVEVRDIFKPGEREHLADVASRWLTVDASNAPSTASRSSKPAKPVVAIGQVTQGVADTSTVRYEEDAETIQWADAVKPNMQRRIELVFPLDVVSPTALSVMDNTRRISNSEVQTFKRCRRKWWLTYYRGLRSTREQPYGARATGTRGHAALAAWYRPSGETRMDPRDALEIIIEAERARLETLSDVTEDTWKKFNKDVELERVVIDGYMQWITETGADAEYTIVGSERYLEADLPEIDNTRIIARLDARVVRNYDQARLFIDHKFVASIPGAVRLLALNEQMQWYILLEQLQSDLHPNQRVAGAVYNMLRRCKRTGNAQPPFYQRVEVRHGPIEIDSFRKRLVGTLDDMQYCRQELDAEEQPHQLIVYPTPTRDCAWDCPFLQVCSMADDGSRFEDALEAHYVADDPYGYYRNPIEKSEE